MVKSTQCQMLLPPTAVFSATWPPWCAQIFKTIRSIGKCAPKIFSSNAGSDSKSSGSKQRRIKEGDKPPSKAPISPPSLGRTSRKFSGTTCIITEDRNRKKKPKKFTYSRLVSLFLSCFPLHLLFLYLIHHSRFSFSNRIFSQSLSYFS